MQNKAMERKLQSGEAVDLAACPRTADGDYDLDEGHLARKLVEGKDLCDAKREVWMWSVGVNKRTGQAVACTSSKFYQNDEFECIWLR